MNTLFLLLRHKRRAIRRSIGQCQTLDEDQLNLTVPGTFRSILVTPQHVAASREGSPG